MSSAAKTSKTGTVAIPKHDMKNCHTCGMKFDNIICSGPSDVLHILDRAKVESVYKSGQYIFHSGNQPLGIYMISQGLVKLEVSTETGHSHTLRIIGPGGILGYRSLFANESYQASALAMEDVEVCFIPKADMQLVFKNHPEIVLKFLNILADDLHQAEKKWMNQMDMGASERIAEALVFLQENFQNQEWTRRDIAQWAGTTPETVMRTLAQFEKDQLINQSNGRQILILNLDGLKTRFRKINHQT